MSEANTALETAAAAVTGEGSPDNASVHRPSSGAVGSIAFALAIACGFGLMIIIILAWAVPWPPQAAALRLHFLGWMGLLSIGCIVITVIAFATPWVGRISASAGNASLNVEAR